MEQLAFGSEQLSATMTGETETYQGSKIEAPANAGGVTTFLLCLLPPRSMSPRCNVVLIIIFSTEKQFPVGLRTNDQGEMKRLLQSGKTSCTDS